MSSLDWVLLPNVPLALLQIEADTTSMRFLLCARHYPPLISGGSRRPYLFAQGLRELGHSVDVVAPILMGDETGFSVPHINSQLPEIVEVETARGGLKATLRQLAYWPDPDIRWARAARKRFHQSADQYDAVLTSSPPESVHWIGASLKRKHKVKWIADFRDNWLESPLDAERKRAYRQFGERWLARRWLKYCDLVIAPTQTILDEIQRHSRSRIAAQLVPQACEPIVPSGHLTPRTSDGSVHIVHSGSFTLSDPDRSIKPSLDVLEELVSEGWDIHISLIGRLTDEEARLARLRLGTRVTLSGLMPRQEVLQKLTDCDALLLSISDGTKAEPGKLAEYKAAQKPILVVGKGAWLGPSGIPDIKPSDLLKRMESGQSVPVPDIPPSPVEAVKMILENIVS